MRFLFVCEYNACRSPMAEGIARHLWPSAYDVVSAGLYPGRVHPWTIAVMQEIGIDISGHRWRLINEVADQSFDGVIVLAEPAFAATQIVPAARRELWPFADPVKQLDDEATVKIRIRAVRNALWARIQALVG